MADIFANVLHVNVTMSAANTSTYTEITTGISLGSKVGILVDQIEYRPDVSVINEMTADGDNFSFMLATSSAAGYSLGDSRVIDLKTLYRHDMGVAASGQLIELPIVKYFNPAIILGTPRLFFFMTSAGLASAGSGSARVYFRYITLTSEQYLEIAETFINVG
jgi:hypothetical protein